jgi:hypothetical protein
VVGSNCALEVADFSELDEFTFLNPVTDFVEITSETIIDKVEIYNIVGNLVAQSTDETNRISTHNLATGVYLLTVYSGDTKSSKKMIVK